MLTFTMSSRLMGLASSDDIPPYSLRDTGLIQTGLSFFLIIL